MEPAGISIKQKFIIWTGVLVLVFASFSILILYMQSRIITSDAEEDRIVQAVEIASSLDIDVLENMVLLRRYVEQPSPQILDLIRINRVSADKKSAELQAITRLPEVAANLKMYEQLLERRRTIADRVIEMVDNKATDREIEKVFFERNVLDDETRAAIGVIIAIERNALMDALAQHDTLFTQMRVWVLSVLTAAFLFMIALITATYRMFLPKIRVLTDIASAIRAGEYSKHSHISGADELSILAQTMDAMADELDRKKKEIEQRTLSLEQGNDELKKLNRFMTDRELKMIEMKKELEERDKKI